MEHSLQRPLAACTIIARNFLSHARTLAQSFWEQEPGGRFYVLVVDGLPAGVEFGGDARVIDPAELQFENWDGLCFQYDPTELCTELHRLLDVDQVCDLILIDTGGQIDSEDRTSIRERVVAHRRRLSRLATACGG